MEKCILNQVVCSYLDSRQLEPSWRLASVGVAESFLPQFCRIPWLACGASADTCSLGMFACAVRGDVWPLRSKAAFALRSMPAIVVPTPWTPKMRKAMSIIGCLSPDSGLLLKIHRL